MSSLRLTLLCFVSIVSCDETFFDNVNCGYERSDSWLAASPWLALIKVLDEVTGNVYTKCSGTVINRRYVLTTASCLWLDKGTKSHIAQLDLAFVQNFSATTYPGTAVLKTLYGFEDTVIHPQYNHKIGQNNIALIRLTRLATYSRFLQPICLPFHQCAIGNIFYTSSWDKIAVAYFPTQKVNLASSLIWGSCTKIKTVELRNNTAKLCNGYVGVPLMFVKNYQYFLLGLLTDAVDCDSNSPGVYLNIYEHLQWINASVTANYDQCVTADNHQQNVCVPLDSCPVLLAAFANPKKGQEALLRKYICSDDRVGGSQVCCPTSLNTSLVISDDEGLDKLSDRRYCGYQHRDDYLSSDEQIALDEFPWLATIRGKGQGNAEFIVCSGSLINNRYILTSAYCLRTSTQITSVRLGEFNIMNKTNCVNVEAVHQQDCSESEDFDIDEIVIHPFYNYWTYSNDIALIRLKKSVVYSNYIRPICLPTPRFKAPAINSTLYTTSFTSPKPWGAYPLKKKLSFSLVENHNCQNKQTVNEYNLCLKPIAREVDPFFTSYVDDGAPAMSSHKNQWILNGITTERVSFGNVNQSVVVTKISSYLHWMRGNMRL